MRKKITTFGTLMILSGLIFGQSYIPYTPNGNNYIRPTTATGFTYFDGGGSVGIGHQSQASGFKLHVYGNTYLEGKVGIGTINITDNYSLSVAGKVRAEEIEISLPSGWADYVFADNYKLNTLSEVEKYIEENHHLPNVPSAKEVTDNGINLGEMDAILLRKIEELTLYILEQEKRLKKLEIRDAR